MRRWMVYKDPEDRWLRWIAVPAQENWWEKPQGRRFPQWDMAMRYADQQARSNTIMIYDHSRAFCYLTATLNHRDLIDLKAGDDTFTLARHEWKPLAKFLLDVDHRKEHHER